MKQVIGVDVNLGERKIVVINSDFDKEKELLYIVSDKDFDNINDAFNYIVNIVYFDKEPKILIDEPPTAILCRMIDHHYNRKNGKGDYIVKLVDVELLSPRLKNRTQEEIDILKKMGYELHKQLSKIFTIENTEEIQEFYNEIKEKVK